MHLHGRHVHACMVVWTAWLHRMHGLHGLHGRHGPGTLLSVLAFARIAVLADLDTRSVGHAIPRQILLVDDFAAQPGHGEHNAQNRVEDSEADAEADMYIPEKYGGSPRAGSKNRGLYK